MIAWVVSSTNSSELKHDILTQLKQQLPSYMVPQELIVLDSMPVTANGKTDKTALLKIAEQSQVDSTYSNSTALQGEPRNDIERRLANIWCDVLKLEHIGVNSDFF